MACQSRSEILDLSEDSGLSSLNNSKLFCVSTPICSTYTSTKTFNTPTTLLTASRKRKFSQCDDCSGTYITPQFSSTLNDSLLNNLQKCNINSAVVNEIHSLPTTPTKQIKCDNKSQSVALPITESPYKEAQKILYPKIKQIVPFKKATPQKNGGTTKYTFSPAKKRLFDNIVIRIDPVMFFRGTDVMSIIFDYVKDSDLYRMSKVSTNWYQAIVNNSKAYSRYKLFVEKYKKNKENYLNTPPNSPPKPDSPPVSPGRQTFHNHIKIAKKLTTGQSIRKCPLCEHPAIVEEDISQCQNIHCNYIYCLNCFSSSTTGPENFHNKCQRSQLLLEKKQKRRLCLADLSNATCDISDITYSSSDSRYDSSGYYSEAERVSSPSVKRNLNVSLSSEKNVLTVHNRSVVTVSKKVVSSPPIIRVVSCNVKQQTELVDPPSPPSVKNVAFSLQSKKNLKRLLR